ncbi:MAG TPA: hypothetical protein VJR94_05940, partial [Candidatus Nitrosocosmicus sp.]|nr:hypothetical protein [Candidatus Nitrosocosmicus sp.]
MNDTQSVGLSFISEKLSNTIDNFWMIVSPNTLLNPFDFVHVENIHDTTTIGIVKEIKRIFLDLDSLPTKHYSSQLKLVLNQQDSFNSGITVANVDVISNFPSIEKKSLDKTEQIDSKKVRPPPINMPVQEGKLVYFASEKEVRIALGIPQMENPIPAGLITMTNNTKIPIDLDISYLFGPDTTHVNATGISGNMKTSYLLFLLQVIHNKLEDEGVSIIMFNTKEKDLLYVDKKRDKEISKEDEELLNSLDLQLTPFRNVKYFLPRGRNGSPNSAHVPEKNVTTYSYELADVYDRLDLLFSSDFMVDPRHNIAAILNYIYEKWPMLGDNENSKDPRRFMSWTDLYSFDDYPEEIITHKSTLLKFQGMIHRFRKPATLFVDKKVTSTYLGNEIKKMKRNEVMVIDIARLSTLEEQAFVVGDVIKTIDEMYSMGEVDYYSLDEKRVRDSSPGDLYEKKGNNKKKPKYSVILLDEVNRFLPHRIPSGSSMGGTIGGGGGGGTIGGGGGGGIGRSTVGE